MKTAGSSSTPGDASSDSTNNLKTRWISPSFPHSEHNGGPQQHSPSSTNFYSEQSMKNSLIVKSPLPDSHRPFKKRSWRSEQQCGEEQNKLSSATLNVYRKPEPLPEDQTQPCNIVRRPPIMMSTSYDSDKNVNNTHFNHNKDKMVDAMIVDEASSSVSAPSLFNIPPMLRWTETTFFVVKDEHKNLVKVRSLGAAQAVSDMLSSPLLLSNRAASSLKIRTQEHGEPTAAKLHFGELSQETINEDDEEIIQDYNINKMFRAIQTQISGGVLGPSTAPPQLAPTDSESMCILMEGLFGSAKSRNLSKNGSMVRQLFRSNISPRGSPQSEPCDEWDGAYSTMQEEMIATPKRTFRKSGTSFSSFASSASGSSRSSCVTPSPTKRMMTSSFRSNMGFPFPPFEENSPQQQERKTSFDDDPMHDVTPSFPELDQSVKALNKVSKQYWLTEQQKIDRAKNFIKIPSRTKAKSRASGSIGRTFSGTKFHHKKAKVPSDGTYSYKRSFAGEAKREKKPLYTDDNTTNQEQGFITKTGQSLDEFSNVQYGTVADHHSNHGFAPSNGKSWEEQKKKIFNPHQMVASSSGDTVLEYGNSSRDGSSSQNATRISGM